MSKILTYIKERPFSFYGTLLSLEHLAIFSFWKTHGSAARELSEPAGPLCWPHFESCFLLRPWVLNNLSWMLAAYLMITVVTVYLFISKSELKLGKIGLLLLNLFKAFIILQDIRLGGNYHYIPFVISFAFILLPQPIKFIKVVLVLLYFIAGLLKFNPLWLSGELIPNLLLQGGLLAKLGSFYVIVLELIIVWGLLAKDKKINFIVFFQYFLFHFISIFQVNYFYPTIMLLLISVYLIFNDTDENILTDFVKFKLPKIHYSLFAVLLLAQAPIYYLPGDSSVTGEGRVPALNMYDGITSCNYTGIVKLKGKDIFIINHPALFVENRIKCDPLTYYSYSKNICRDMKKRADFESFGWGLVTRSRTWQKFEQIVSLNDFCKKMPGYNYITKNNWIAPLGNQVEFSWRIPKASLWAKPTPMRLRSEIIYGNVNLASIKIKDNKSISKTQDNKLVWRLNHPNGFNPKFVSYKSVLIYGTIDGDLYAINTNTGNILWKMKVSSIGTPFYTIYNGIIYATDFLFDQYTPPRVKIYSIDPLSGSVLNQVGPLFNVLAIHSIKVDKKNENLVLETNPVNFKIPLWKLAPL